jgi:hypothetical protein
LLIVALSAAAQHAQVINAGAVCACDSCCCCGERRLSFSSELQRAQVTDWFKIDKQQRLQKTFARETKYQSDACSSGFAAREATALGGTAGHAQEYSGAAQSGWQNNNVGLAKVDSKNTHFNTLST